MDSIEIIEGTPYAWVSRLFREDATRLLLSQGFSEDEIQTQWEAYESGELGTADILAIVLEGLKDG